MRHFYTSVVELRQPFAETIASEPYECGWADEAIFFVTVEDDEADFDQLALRVQISADGIHWIDEGTTGLLAGPGLTACRVRHFGGWLRVTGELSGGAQRAVLSVRLVLKG
ncbi:MAG: hypothetical protein JWN95_695 [Frankiales bacterium]|nr:hypothetical protein [Frankiales bacterium]